MNSGMSMGDGTNASLLGERYRLLRELSQQTYLAEDLSRGQKYCVLKALVPSVKDQATLDKARELLEPAVNKMRQLDHQQVVNPGQLLQINTQSTLSSQAVSTNSDTDSDTDNTSDSRSSGGYLFFVRDYVEGKTYHQLLQERQQIGGTFSEVEITQLLYQLLPVLSHIHGLGITHGDITPDNIVLKQSTGLPVLIDFCNVKTAARQVSNQLSIGGSGTTTAQPGKVGYIPPEQLVSGYTDITSDLYGLAATLLVLGTGKDPQDLNDTTTGSWTGFDTFSPKLGAILSKMLEVYPNDRYQTADTVLAALQSGQSQSSQLDKRRSGGEHSGDQLETPLNPQNLLTNEKSLDQVDASITDQADQSDQSTENAAFVSSMFSVDSFAEAAAADSISVEQDALYPPVDTTDEIVADSTVAVPAQISVEGFSDDVLDQSAAIYDTTAYDATEGYPRESGVTPIVGARMTGTDHKPISSTYETTLAESQVHEPEMADEVVEKRDSRQAILPLLILLGIFATFLGLAWMNSFFTDRRRFARENRPRVENVAEWEGPYSREETTRRGEIAARRDALGLGENTFNRLVDQIFYETYPTLRTSGAGGGRKALTEAPEDEPLRLRWDNIALELLDTFEGNLSRRSLARLGDYSESDRARWQSQVNQVNVSTQALYDLVDAKFLSLFPGQNSEDFLRLPGGQLYYAIAEDKAQAIEEGAARESVEFADGTYRTDITNRIGPGNGRVYLLQLTAGQLLRVSLNAEPSESTLLSIYQPSTAEDSSAIINDSEQTTWSGEVGQTGIYEITVVNQSDTAVNYELAIAADNVSTTPPVAPPRPTESASEDEAEDSNAESTEQTPTEDLPPISEEDSETEASDSSSESADNEDEADSPDE